MLKKMFRKIKKFPRWIYVPPVFLLHLTKLLLMRTEIRDPHNYMENISGAVTVTWHNRLMFFPVMFPSRLRRRTVAIVSPSRDGQYIVDLISIFGIRSLRGSSNKRGMQVQLEAIKAIKEGYFVSFTPDGPRGPKYHMNKGPVHLASCNGVPLIPISINYSNYWQIRSWDNFQIPKPFAKIILVIGERLDIPPDLTSEQLEEYRAQAERALMSITKDPLPAPPPRQKRCKKDTVT